MSNDTNECFCMSGMLVNQLITSDVFFHWLSFVVFLIVELILSRICLLTLPSSLFAGFMRRRVRWLAKLSLWSFRKNHQYNKIFNKNNIKVSYRCTDNLQIIIKKHNRKIPETSQKPSTENNCNCRKKSDCPLKKNCLTSSVVYNANVTTESDTIGKNYIGLTEGTFKQRYTQHKLSFRNRNYSKLNKRSELISKCRHENKFYLANFTSRQR